MRGREDRERRKIKNEVNRVSHPFYIPPNRFGSPLDPTQDPDRTGPPTRAQFYPFLLLCTPCFTLAPPFALHFIFLHAFLIPFALFSLFIHSFTFLLFFYLLTRLGHIFIIHLLNIFILCKLSCIFWCGFILRHKCIFISLSLFLCRLFLSHMT